MALKLKSNLRKFVIPTITCSAKNLAFNFSSYPAENRKSLGSCFQLWALWVIGCDRRENGMEKKGGLRGTRREGFLLFGKRKCEEWEWRCLALPLGGLFLKVCDGMAHYGAGKALVSGSRCEWEGHCISKSGDLCSGVCMTLGIAASMLSTGEIFDKLDYVQKIRMGYDTKVKTLYRIR